MAIDFTLPREGTEVRERVRDFIPHEVALMSLRVTNRALQVHDALGYSTNFERGDMLRPARSGHLVDGADEVHRTPIAEILIDVFTETGSTRGATGADLL